MVSCYYTAESKYICFYLKSYNKTFITRAYKSDLSNPIESTVYTSVYQYLENFFLKAFI